MPKLTILLLSLILFTSMLLGWSGLTHGHLWGDDFAAYIMQAKSIANGNMQTFIEHNTFTILNSSAQIGPFAYPWGFPLLLVPIYSLFGLNPLLLKLPGLITYLGFLLVFFFMTKRRFTTAESLLAVSLFAFNPELLHFIDNILSDIPFLLLSTLSIFLADMYVHETKKKYRLSLAVGTGVAIFGAFFFRTQGLILLGTLLLFQSIRVLGQRKQRQNIIIDSLLVVVVFSILWGTSALIFPGGQTSYLALYSGFSLDLLIDNIPYYSSTFSQFFETLPGKSLAFGIFVVFFFIGVVSRFLDELLYVLYATLYLIVLWSWPERQGYRFLFPLLPLFVYFAIQGIRETINKIGGKRKALLQKSAYAYLLLNAILFSYSAGSYAYINLRDNREINGPFDPFSMETYDFVKANTPVDSVIVFFKPRAMRLMTDRNSLALTECDRIVEGDYLVLSKKVGENLQIPPERIYECELPLDKVFQNRRFEIYQILK